MFYSFKLQNSKEEIVALTISLEGPTLVILKSNDEIMELISSLLADVDNFEIENNGSWFSDDSTLIFLSSRSYLYVKAIRDQSCFSKKNADYTQIKYK